MHTRTVAAFALLMLCACERNDSPAPAAAAQNSTTPAPTGASRPDLRTRRQIAVDGKPESLLAADLDGDGKRELIAATLAPGALILWRGTEHGLEAQPRTLAVGGWPLAPLAVAPGSFGGDRARAQVAVATRADARVTLYDPLGPEPGKAGRSIALPGAPRAMDARGTRPGEAPEIVVATDEHALVRWPSDGEPATSRLAGELPRCLLLLADDGAALVGFQASASLELYPRAADGRAFADAPELALQLTGIPRALAEADLDGDGDLELAAIGGDADLWVFGLGRTGGSRAWRAPDGRAPAHFATRAVPLDLEAADFDGDGRADLLLVDFGNLAVELFERWTPAGPGATRSVYAGQTPTSLAACDLDGDGVLDLAVSNRDASALSRLLGDGQGGLQAPLSAPAGSFPSSIACADLDGDGAAEALALCAKDGTLAVVGKSGKGFERRASLPAGAAPRALLSADLDGDGRADAAWLAAEPAGARVELRFGDGAGRLASRADAPAIALGGGDDLVALDLDRDGRLDLVAADADGGALYLLLSAKRAAPALWAAPVPVEFADSPRALATLRFDDDAAPELAVAFASAARAGFAVLAVDPAAPGKLRELARTAVHGRPQDVLAGDLDGDGRDDVAVLTRTDDRAMTGAIELFLRSASGEPFAAQPPAATGLNPTRMALGRIGGPLALLVAAQNSHVIDAWELARTPAGALSVARCWDLGAGLGPLDVAIADVDGDGLLDVVVANAFSDDVGVLLGGAR